MNEPTVPTYRSRWDDIVRHHIRKLPRGMRVRKCAENILDGGKLNSADYTMLLDVLDKKSENPWREVLVSCWCLGSCELPTEKRDCATSELRRLLTRQQAPNRDLPADAIMGVLSAIVMFIVGAIALFATILIFYQFGIPLFLFMLLVLASPLIAIRILKASRNTLAQAAAARSLGNLADPISVGILATTMMSSGLELRAAAADALWKNLSAVLPEHYGVLPPDATTSLCAALGSSITLDAAILKALGNAGTGAAVDRVRRLASESYASSTRKIAQEVLPILEERLRQETSAARLLRPAESPRAAENVLLRPASSATAVPEEQLLRPSSSHEDGSD